MTPVEPGYGAYLKSPALYASATVPGVAAKWGERAKASTLVSPLATKDDALIEAERQAAFLAGPIARDRHVVKGQRTDLIGRVVTLAGDRLGYQGPGANVFVIGAAENANGTTTLTVLKRL